MWAHQAKDLVGMSEAVVPMLSDNLLVKLHHLVWMSSSCQPG